MKDGQLLFDSEVAATWTDDVSKTCKVDLNFTPSNGSSKAINSGDKLEEAGKLEIKVSDEAGNSSTGEIKLTLSDTKAPEIELKIQEKNVVAGVKIAIQDNQLLFDQDVAATWKDDYTENCTIELALIPIEVNQRVVNSGETIIEPGKLTLSVADEFQNKSMAEITLTSIAITGLENLQNLSLQVDQTVNLLEGLTITEGLTLAKVEVEQDGVKGVISDAKTYTPEYPGTVNIILTISKPDGSTIEVRVDGIRVKGLSYNSMPISNLKPRDILPIVDQVEEGDKQAYYHIEHIRLAEATKVRDMMWEYGSGRHSKDEYQQLMGRLMTGMMGENPKWYNNYIIVGD